MLAAAENASPVDAVEAVTRELGAALGARTVSFLIADLSGRALVRLSNTSLPVSGSGRRDGREVATVLPFDDGPAEQALRAQTLQVIPQADGWLVLAPVTERGEVIGLLEMVLPTEPDSKVLAEIGRTAHALAFVVIANRRHTDLFELDSGPRRSPCRRRSSGACCRPRSPARRARSPGPAGWSPRPASAGTPSTTVWPAMCFISASPTPWVTGSTAR